MYVFARLRLSYIYILNEKDKNVKFFPSSDSIFEKLSLYIYYLYNLVQKHETYNRLDDMFFKLSIYY